MDVPVVNAPVSFTGTPEERAVNFATHRFSVGEDERCFGCDCKPWHVTASYPCGEEPPRTVFDLPIAAWAMQDYEREEY